MGNNTLLHGLAVTDVEDVLVQLLEAEYQYKNTRAMESRIKSAKIPWEDWSIDTFPFKQKPEINRPQIMSLAKLEFIN
jgi:DNA replication protein DnaC